MGRIPVLCLVLFVGGVGLSVWADDLPEDPVSDALKTKYQPLMEKFQTSFEAGDFATALPQILSIRSGVEKDLPPTHSAVFQINFGLATVYAKLKKAKEAEAVLSDLQKRLTQKKLTDTPKALFVWQGVRDLEKELGNDAKAKEADTQVKALLKKHPDWSQGNNEADQRKKEEGKQAQQDFSDRFGEVYQAFGADQARALDLARKLADDAEGKFGPDAPVALQARRLLAMALGNLGRDAEADAELARLQGQLEGSGRAPTMDLLLVLDDRAQTARRQGGDPSPFDQKVAALTAKNQDLAAQWKTEQEKRAQKDKDEGNRKPKGPDASDEITRQLGKADQMAKEGKPGAAVDVLKMLRDKARGQLPPEDPILSEIDKRLDEYTRAEASQKGTSDPRVEEGVTLLDQATQASDPDLYRQAVALLDFDPQPRRDQALGLARWAKLVLAQGNADRAEVLLLKSLEVLGRVAPGKDPDRATVATQLADLYRSMGNGPAEKEARTQAAQAQP